VVVVAGEDNYRESMFVSKVKGFNETLIRNIFGKFS